MATEATQSTGAEMADIESIFADDPDLVAESQQLENGTDAQQATQPNNGEAELEILDEDGNPVALNEVEVDADGNPIELDPDQLEQPTELVVPDDHKVKLTIDGKEVEYSFGDLKAGAQKFAAANKRFEEAAAIRKEYEGKSAGLQTREGQLGQVLQFYIEQSQQYMAKEPNWAELIQNDPQKYLAEKHNWELRMGQLAQARQVQENLHRHQAAEQQASAAQRIAEAKQRLEQAIPEWADPVKAAEGAQAIDKYLHAQGISPQMRGSIDSAEVLMIARKAMLYDEAVAAAKAKRASGGKQQAAAQAAQGQQQQRQAPSRQVRVERPGAATQAQSAAGRANITRHNAQKAFDANPSVDTLANFF